MTIKSEKLLIPVPTSGPCPTCSNPKMNVQAKDMNSDYRDWVTCQKDGCPYADTIVNFKNWLANN